MWLVDEEKAQRRSVNKYRRGGGISFIGFFLLRNWNSFRKCRVRLYLTWRPCSTYLQRARCSATRVASAKLKPVHSVMCLSPLSPLFTTNLDSTLETRLRQAVSPVMWPNHLSFSFWQCLADVGDVIWLMSPCFSTADVWCVTVASYFLLACRIT